MRWLAKMRTVTVEVSGNQGPMYCEETLRKLVYTEDVYGDLEVARTLVRAARLIHPEIDNELRKQLGPERVTVTS